MTGYDDTAARVEAERRWGSDIIATLAPAKRSPSNWHDMGMASGFALGATWQAEREPVDVRALVRDLEALTRQESNGKTDISCAGRLITEKGCHVADLATQIFDVLAKHSLYRSEGGEAP